MQRRHLASATPSSAGNIKIDDALDFPKKEEINDASAFFPHQEEINDTSAFPRTKKINDGSALLLYQAPSGIAVFSFDGGYLNDQDFYSDGSYRNDSVKDFWACLPPLTLRISMNYKKVPTPIDLVKEAIDERLRDRLIMLCGSGKKLVVGSVEYKRIIEADLEKITCLYVDAPDSEVIIHSLKNPMQSVKINPALAMLLYQAPSGIAIFCFDEGHLNAPVKDFWACLPQLNLIAFIKEEKMPTPIDLAKEVIDDRLAKKLRQLFRGSKRKLVVGSAEYERIIGTKLVIACLHRDVPDCEVIICGLNKPMPPLSPEKQFEPGKDLELFLNQRDFDVKLKMLDKSMEETAYLLHDTESQEKDYLKFFRLLLKDFMRTSEIDTKSWVLIQFATALKMICYPGASYEVLPPDEIFSFGECQKIEAHASRYKRSFFKIDVLSVFKNVSRLETKKCILMIKLDIWIIKAKKVYEKADVRLSNDHFSGRLDRTDLCTGSEVGKTASADVDGRLNSSAQDNCSDLDDGKPATKTRTSPKEKRRTEDNTSTEGSDSSDVQKNSDGDHEIVETDDASKPATQTRTSPEKSRTGDDNSIKGSDSSDIQKDSNSDHETVETRDSSKPATKTRTSPKEKRRTEDNTSTEGSDSSDIQKNSDGDHEIVETDDTSKPATRTRTSPEKSRTGDDNSVKGSDSSDIQKDSDSDHETVETRDSSKPATKTRTSPKEKRRTEDNTSTEGSDSSDIQKNSDGDHEIVETDDASKPATQTRTSPEKSRTGDDNSIKGSDSSDIQKDSDSDHETVETRDASKPATKTRTSPKEKRWTGDDNSIEESDSSDIQKNSDGEIVETDDASKPATHAASRRLDSSPSKQKGEIPGTTSGRLKDLIAWEMERERMETRSKKNVSQVSRIPKAPGVKQRCMPLARWWKSAEYTKRLD